VVLRKPCSTNGLMIALSNSHSTAADVSGKEGRPRTVGLETPVGSLKRFARVGLEA